MNLTLLKALIALTPVAMLFAGAVVWFRRGRTAWSLLQMLGAGCLVLVVFTHIAEALRLLSWMHWGQEHGAGHYVDLASAILGSALFPAGYLFQALSRRL
jgi:hypothetical protein